MKKEKMVTAFAFVFAFSVVIGGWFTVMELLNRKETEMMNRKGIAYESDSEITVSKGDDEGNSSDSGISEGVPVSSDEMAMILAVWGDSAVEVPHEPGNGQMTMDQAMTAGANWIDAMARKEILPFFLSECSFDSVNAKLCTMEQKTSLDERLLSFWQVTYKKEDIEIVLKIHAASGQVWRAEVSMDGDRESYGAYTDDELLAEVFPFIDGRERMICAKAKRYSIKKDDTTPVVRLILWLDVKKE